MKVIFAREARSDLREISDYVALESRKRAVRLLDDLQSRARDIGRNPLRFR